MSYAVTWYDKLNSGMGRRQGGEKDGQPGHVEQNQREEQAGGRTGQHESGTGAAQDRGDQMGEGRKCSA